MGPGSVRTSAGSLATVKKYKGTCQAMTFYFQLTWTSSEIEKSAATDNLRLALQLNRISAGSSVSQRCNMAALIRGCGTHDVVSRTVPIRSAGLPGTPRPSKTPVGSTWYEIRQFFLYL